MPDTVPATTTSELIPIGDLSLQERASIRSIVDSNLVDIAIRRSISNDPGNLVVRDILPYTDLGLTGSSNAEEWLITSAATAGTLLNYINARQLTTTQAAAFFGVGSPMASPQVSALKFYYGSANAQVKAYFQLEQLFSRLESQGYFGAPLYYGPQEFLTVQVMPISSFAASTERLTLIGRIVDLFGQTISAHNNA
jgi:hypothetical protein